MSAAAGPVAPPGEVYPVTGEFFQSLCDVGYMTRKYYNSTDVAALQRSGPSHERLRFVEDGFPPEVLTTTRSLFLVPEEETGLAVFAQQWPALRLLIFHQSDACPPLKAMLPFLEAHPAVEIWAANLQERHPRVRPLPLGIQAPFWQGSATFPLQREAEREPYLLCCWRWDTNDRRPDWFRELKYLCDTDPRLARQIRAYRSMEPEEYMEMLKRGVGALCPPGNGLDTHRTWEVLYFGGWAYLEDNWNTRLLLEAYPGLPLIPIQSPTALIETTIPPAPCPSPLHPCLTREYWVAEVARAVGGPKRPAD